VAHTSEAFDRPAAAGKTIVVTGATAGLGEAAATLLAAEGARIVFTARNRDRGERLLDQLRALNPAAAHAVHYGDLSSLDDLSRIGAALAESLPRVDVLVNNAAGWFEQREETADGLERTFALNHMGYFVISRALLPRLLAADGARVVNVTSRAHARNPLDFDDLQSRRDYEMLTAYGRSKLCNVLLTRSLAARLAPRGTTTCFHPGTVFTSIWEANAASRQLATTATGNADVRTVEEAAATVRWHALSAEAAAQSGAYFEGCDLVPVSPEVSNHEAAERLWRISEALADRR
jgi:NAD(P)-dependent dehydrogenase (short-subunit alcohol dehydrogenase family)